MIYINKNDIILKKLILLLYNSDSLPLKTIYNELCKDKDILKLFSCYGCNKAIETKIRSNIYKYCKYRKIQGHTGVDIFIPSSIVQKVGNKYSLFYTNLNNKKVKEKFKYLEIDYLINDNIFEEDISSSDNIEFLLKSINKYPPCRREIQISQFIRDPRIKKLAQIRANGFCELCGISAPFTTKSGIPYLEVHHIISLCNNGEDTIENVIAICPTCHRKIHYADEKLTINDIKNISIKLKKPLV